MTLRKYAADFADRSLAYATAHVIENLLDPPPEALTVFEAGAAGWRVEAYFDVCDGREIEAEIVEIVGNIPLAFQVEDVPDLNWVALSQAALPPVHAGRFIIHGSHDRTRVARGPNAILIDAGEAFGTAHHATTYGCLLAIDRLARGGRMRNVLDLGCGSGVLAIATARAMPHARIIATDIDPQSVRVAAANARLNGAADRIAYAVATGLSHPAVRSRTPFDLIIANILAGPLLMLAPHISRALQSRGTLVLSGLLTPQAPQIIAMYRTCGLVLARHDRVAGWSTLTLLRR